MRSNKQCCSSSVQRRMHARTRLLALKHLPVALLRLCLQGVLETLPLELTKTSLGNASVACRPWEDAVNHLPAKYGTLPAKDEEVPAICRALPTKDESLPAISGALPATGMLWHQAPTKHKIEKWQGLPRVYMYYTTPKHLKTSRERYSRIHDHQSRIPMHDGQRSNLCKSIWKWMHK